MIRYAKNGNVMGMPTPYGYDRVYFDEAGKEMCWIERGERFRMPRAWTAKLVPEKTRGEVKTVRWMFRAFASDDRSARSLAVELNKRKVPSPKRKPKRYPAACGSFAMMRQRSLWLRPKRPKRASRRYVSFR